ncbi:MAG: RNA polymerase sigma factor [Bacteroidales bacterium]|nr:RNA polymerase sigma factor [Bacteroidales bacterium]
MSEKVLAEQCVLRNTAAEREIFCRYNAMLRGICLRYAADADDAEDMLQEGFIKIFNSIESFTWKGEGSFSAWMRRVMVNNAINIYKKSKRMKSQFIDSADYEPYLTVADDQHGSDENSDLKNVMDAGITQEMLLDMLKQLPEKYSIVFNLAVIDGIRHKEIADSLGIDESSSRSRLLRAKMMLRKKLEEYMKNFKNVRQIQNSECI